MKHENTRALYAYWNSLRAGRPAPFRSELDPRAIAPLLESTFILEHNDAAAPRFRLAGTKLCDQFGLELRGMSALALWHGDGRTQMRDLLMRVVGRPGVGLAACTVETRNGYLYEAEFLFLPLYSDTGVLNRILGCGYYMGGRDFGLVGHEPVHHWVDKATLTPVDGPASPVVVEAPLFGRSPYEGRITVDALRAKREELEAGAARTPRATVSDLRAGAARSRRAREAHRPLLYAIDGGVRDKSAVARAASELRRAEPELNRPNHLRLVRSTDLQPE